MKKSIWHYRIRRLHRYLGVLLGIQFLLWTVGGLYFSWSNMDEIHSDPQKRPAPQIRTEVAVVSPSVVLHQLTTDSILSVELFDMLGNPTYRVSYLHQGMHQMYQLADAITGNLRPALNTTEAIALAKQQYNGQPNIKTVQLLTEVNGHHEYREDPLPAVAVTFAGSTNTTVYVATEMGVVTKYRNSKWRIFDFLWMLHTMDYNSRDNIGNWLLRVFSIFGLFTVFSGFTLYFVSWRRKK